MKTYHELSQQLNEAKAPAALVQKAEDARDKAIQFTTKLIDKLKKMDPKFTEEIKRLSDDLKWFRSMNLNNMSKREISDKLSIFNTASINSVHQSRLMHWQQQMKLKAKDDVLESNPISICDLLADKDPKRFISLLKDGGYEMVGFKADGDPIKWVEALNKYQDAFSEWFESQGGSKADIVKKFKEITACKTRAPWAYFEGKVWRGVSRTSANVSRYTLTGETKKIGSTTYFIAKGKYVSRYEAQSWTTELNIAKDFSKQNIAMLEFPVPVIFEVELAKKDTLLGPDVIKKVSGYGKEKEVIRVGNNPLPVTIYIDIMRDIEKIVSDTIYDRTKVDTPAKKAIAKIKAGLAKRFGDKNAATILADDTVMAYVKKKMKSAGIKGD